MAKNKSEIKTTFDKLTVTANDRPAGLDIFDNDWLRNKECRVLATFIHRYEDGSGAPVFMVQDTDGTIRHVACERCRVVEN